MEGMLSRSGSNLEQAPLFGQYRPQYVGDGGLVALRRRPNRQAVFVDMIGINVTGHALS
jgi:hypothetical protein